MRLPTEVAARYPLPASAPVSAFLLWPLDVLLKRVRLVAGSLALHAVGSYSYGEQLAYLDVLLGALVLRGESEAERF